MEKEKRFDNALYGVSPKIRNVLEKLPGRVKESTEEIRLRAGLPVALTVGGDTVFVLANIILPDTRAFKGGYSRACRKL